MVRSSARPGHAATAILWIGVTLVALPGAAGSQDGIGLTLERDAATAQLDLVWTGGVAPYKIYRSSEPSLVVVPANQIGDTTGLSFTVSEGAADLDFFRVTGFAPTDLNSPVSATSSCLTAGSNAISVIAVDLVDTFGNPVTGASVTLAATDGTLGALQVDGNTYWAELTPPAGAGAVTITATADGSTLTTQPVVTIAAPFADPGGGAGGCSAVGNLRVRTVTEDGLPLAGAHVMVGDFEVLNSYRTTFGAPPDGDNTGLTDPTGSIEFRDFGSRLDGPLTITVAADQRRYVTMIDVDAADLVLPLPPVEPVEPTGIYSGDIAPIPAPDNDPVEFGIMLPDFTLDSLAGLTLDALTADSECYDAGGVAGQVAVPSNIYFPAQCALRVFVCVQSLPEKNYTSAPLPFGERRLSALSVAAPLAALTSGDLADVLLADLDFEGTGVVVDDLDTAGPRVADLPITNPLTTNMTCQIDGPPLNSDVFCVAAGDWDSFTDPAGSPGSGRLFVTGFKAVDSATVAIPFDIDGVTTVVDSGSFAGIDYLGAAVAQYIDPLEPGIPPGTEFGTSAILDRSGTAFDGTGGRVRFDDFFPIRTLSRFGRELALGALPGSGHPTADFARVVIDQRISELYTACLVNDSTRVRRNTLWEVYVPGSREAWTLPTPPTGWPREEAGGDLAGLVDPLTTPEDDALVWDAQTYHLGLLPGFDFDGIRFVDPRDHATHLTINSAEY